MKGFFAVPRVHGCSRLLGGFLSVFGWMYLSASPVLADTVEIPPNSDTTIFSESGALSNGAGSYFFAGQTNSTPRTTPAARS